MKDPTQAVSQAYNQNNVSMEGPGKNRIQIVDQSNEERERQAKKQEKSGCCKSC